MRWFFREWLNEQSLKVRNIRKLNIEGWDEGIDLELLSKTRKRLVQKLFVCPLTKS